MRGISIIRGFHDLVSISAISCVSGRKQKGGISLS
jgi:hypothetical protein